MIKLEIMAIVYNKSFSGSLSNGLEGGFQIPMSLPALTAGTAYTFSVGFNTTPPEANFPNTLGFYVTYETQMNNNGTTSGLSDGGKYASGSVVFPATNQKFITGSDTVASSLVHTDFNISSYGAFDNTSNQNPNFVFTPLFNVPESGSNIRVVGSNYLQITISD